MRSKIYGEGFNLIRTKKRNIYALSEMTSPRAKMRSLMFLMQAIPSPEFEKDEDDSSSEGSISSLP